MWLPTKVQTMIQIIYLNVNVGMGAGLWGYFAEMNAPKLITVTRTVAVNKRNKFRHTVKFGFTIA